jgi:predicted translin family RNA/ssDNA-binding protein
MSKKTKVKKNFRKDENLSINMLSLTPHAEMNSTATIGISKLINKLYKECNKLIKTYRKNRITLKKKHNNSRIIVEKINKTITNIEDINDYINNINKQKQYIEFSIKNGKSITKKIK